MKRHFRDMYHNAAEFLRTFGAFQLFFLRLLKHSPYFLFTRFGVVVKQIYNTGALSLVIVMVCGLFVGAVLALQAYSNMSRFNAEDWTGVAAAFALVKELGPVMTAILFAGRAGTALTSEIGLMKATDQLAAMEMMAVNPVRRVLVPRFPGWRDRDAPACSDLQRGRDVRRASRGRRIVSGRCRLVLAADSVDGRTVRRP